FTEEQNKKLLLTTVGKIIFNGIIPETFPYINEPTNSNLEIETPEKYFLEQGTDIRAEIKSREDVATIAKGILGDIIDEVFKLYQISETSKMLDRMKDLGFYYSTRAGLTVGVSDIVVLKEKPELLEEAQGKVDEVLKQFRRGLITEEERYNRVIS